MIVKREVYLQMLIDKINNVDRNCLRGEETLDKLVDILASSVGSLTSSNKLSKLQVVF